MIAQVELEPWHVWAGGAIALLYAVTRCGLALYKARSDNHREDAKEHREQKRDYTSTEFLRKISDSNIETAKGVLILSERLESQMKVMIQMHTENITRMPTICPMNKPNKKRKIK